MAVPCVLRTSVLKLFFVVFVIFVVNILDR